MADVLDVLTSRRAYRAAWRNEEAFVFVILRQMFNPKLDGDYVEALINNIDKILEVQQRFHDNDLIRNNNYKALLVWFILDPFLHHQASHQIPFYIHRGTNGIEYSINR